MADTKKVRTIEERKAAMLAELAELEGKQLEKYRKELDVKAERLDKIDEMIARYTAEAGTLKVRVDELTNLIAELVFSLGEGSDEAPAEADTTVLEAENA